MQVLKVENISKTYGKNKVLDQVSLQMEQGEILGLLGPNGAGKTTLMKIIAGLVYADKGSFSVCGEKWSYSQAYMREVGCLIEETRPYLDLTGFENLKLVARARGVSFSKLQCIVQLIGLESVIHRKAKTFSLGMKQRLGLGMALVGSPQLLILDEPLNGIDPEAVISFRNHLLKIAKKEGISILISSHDLQEMSRLCDRIAYINQGKIQRIKDNSLELCGRRKQLRVLAEDSFEALKDFNKVFKVTESRIDRDLILVIEDYDEGVIKDFLKNHRAIYGVSILQEDIEESFRRDFGGRQ